MVNEKSKANLIKGREKGIKRKKTAVNRCNKDNTFSAIFHFIESREITDGEWELLDKIAIRKADVKAAGITDFRKLKKCVNIFLDDSPAAVKEYLQRSEPQDPLIMNLDLTKLSTEQLEQLANGEDARTVIFARAGGD